VACLAFIDLFRLRGDQARGWVEGSDVARRALVRILCRARRAAECDPLAPAVPVPDASRSRWTLCGVQRDEAVRRERGGERDGQAANQVSTVWFPERHPGEADAWF